MNGVPEGSHNTAHVDERERCADCLRCVECMVSMMVRPIRIPSEEHTSFETAIPREPARLTSYSM